MFTLTFPLILSVQLLYHCINQSLIAGIISCNTKINIMWLHNSMDPFDIIYQCKAIQMLKTIKQITLHLETREIWLHRILHTFPMGIASAYRDKLCTAAAVYFLARNKVICTCLSPQSFLVAITRLRWNQM